MKFVSVPFLILGFAAPLSAFTAFSNSRTLAFTGRVTDSSMRASLEAILFDCDGVLADTERDGHRVSFNRAFKANNIDENWDVDRYGVLLEVGGGKERMTAHWNEVGWPEAIPGKCFYFFCSIHMFPLPSLCLFIGHEYKILNCKRIIFLLSKRKRMRAREK